MLSNARSIGMNTIKGIFPFLKKNIIKSAILHSNVDRQIRKDNYNWIVTYWLMKFQDIVPFFYEKIINCNRWVLIGAGKQILIRAGKRKT